MTLSITVSSVIMLNVLRFFIAILSVIMLSVVMLSVFMQNVVMLSVMAPVFSYIDLFVNEL